MEVFGHQGLQLLPIPGQVLLKWTPFFGQKTSDPSLHPVRPS
jgi:hypothetical protein